PGDGCVAARRDARVARADARPRGDGGDRVAALGATAAAVAGTLEHGAGSRGAGSRLGNCGRGRRSDELVVDPGGDLARRVVAVAGRGAVRCGAGRGYGDSAAPARPVRRAAGREP